MTANGRVLIYIVGTYPLLTTTFIDREIRQLRRWGIEVKVFSIRQPPEEIPLSAAQVQLREGVRYLLPPDLLKLLLSHLHFLIRKPAAFLGCLFYLLTSPHPTLRARFKTLLHFGEGVYAAYLARELKFRELHAHFIDRAATVALVMGRLLDKPYSLSIHAAEDIYVHPILLHEKISAARHAVTCTRYNKAHIEAHLGCSLEDKVSFIPHGLDVETYRPRALSTESTHRILAVGQLVQRKGFAELIRACRILRDRGHRFRCEIVGTGPLLQELEAMIADLRLHDRVEICGALPHEEVIARYRRASLFVLPCVQSPDGNMDGIPNVLLEAMAMQIPVISTRVSAIPELITDGENGVLVEPGDRLGLAEAIEALMRSPERAARLAGNGRKTVVSNYDLAANVRRFANTFWPDWIE